MTINETTTDSITSDIITTNSITADDVGATRERLAAVSRRIGSVVLGQAELVEGMLLGLLCGGHVLIEGVPGLAKTSAVATLASCLDAKFCRLQFTPDLLPSDIVGSEIYRPEQQRFEVQRGPLFANIVLVDEINRAPAKVQSALLEAMQDRQISIAGQTQKLPEPFMVLATQNPIDQQGTYALPEAQMDRFLMKLVVRYPPRQHELTMLHQSLQPAAKPESLLPLMSADDIHLARRAMATVHVSAAIEAYIMDLVAATRDPQKYGCDFSELIRFGVSPRGTLALAHLSRARAFLAGRAHVVPEDVQALIPSALRHRILLSYEALAQEQSADDILRRLLEQTPVP